MTIKNNSKRLIVINYLEGATRKHLQLGAGCQVENEHIKDEDIAFYVKRESITKIGDTAVTSFVGSNDNNTGTKTEPIKLPDEKTLESLTKALSAKEMKQYWKDNSIGKVTGLNETELATGILTHLGIVLVDDAADINLTPPVTGDNADTNLTPPVNGGSEE